MSLQSFRKNNKNATTKEEKKLTPASRNLNSGKKKIKPVVKKLCPYFSIFYFIPFFFLSPRKADFILKNIKPFMFVLAPITTFLIRPKNKALSEIKLTPIFLPTFSPKTPPLLIIIIRKKVNRLPLV